MNAPLEKSLIDTIKAPHFPIYLDYSATTPVDPRVADKMIPYLREQFGNPASRSHMYGWTAEKAVEEAREHVAALVNADPREIIWTSGATESNNLALKGAAQFYKTRGKHIITVKTEHKAVLDTVRELERQGFEATYLQPQDNGLVTVQQIADHVFLIANGKVVAQGDPKAIANDGSPWTRQFFGGEADGPVPFQYPAGDYAQALGLAGADR